MKRKNADKLLLRVMKILVQETDYQKRLSLYNMVGEGLVTEYKDMKKDRTQKEIDTEFGVVGGR